MLRKNREASLLRLPKSIGVMGIPITSLRRRAGRRSIISGWNASAPGGAFYGRGVRPRNVISLTLATVVMRKQVSLSAIRTRLVPEQCCRLGTSRSYLKNAPLSRLKHWHTT